MARVQGKMLDTGQGTEQLNLGTIPATTGHDAQTLQKGKQKSGGNKELTAIASSPNSADDIISIPEDELVTFEQLEKYRGQLITSVVPALDNAPTEAIVIDEAKRVVTLNPPITAKPTTGQLYDRGTTEEGRTFVDVYFGDGIDIVYKDAWIDYTGARTIRVYTSPYKLPTEPPAGLAETDLPTTSDNAQEFRTYYDWAGEWVWNGKVQHWVGATQKDGGHQECDIRYTTLEAEQQRQGSASLRWEGDERLIGFTNTGLLVIRKCWYVK